MLGATEDYSAVPWFWSDQYDVTLQIAGLSSLATRYITRHRPDGVNIAFGLDDDNHLTCASDSAPEHCRSRHPPGRGDAAR